MPESLVPIQPQLPPPGGPAARLGALLGGRYRLEAHIASGGMGRVFRARDEVLQRRVAIKVLREQNDAKRRESFRQRFVREASIAAQLTHPHCVTLFDYGLEADGTCFMAMELLRGQTLAELLKVEGRLPAARALALVQQIAAALSAVHAMGAMHRDLKPGNIFVLDETPAAGPAGARDFVKVLDFGLTKQVGLSPDPLTHLGQTLGSPNYMAPEQVRGSEVDGRVDIYALGAVLFEMLTGRAPYARTTPLATMMAHLEEPTPRLGPVPPPDCPEAAWHRLGALLQRALAKAPEARFASMPAFAEGLGQVQLRSTPADGEQMLLGAGPRDETALVHPNDDGRWRIVSARGALGYARTERDAPAGDKVLGCSETTWVHELKLLAGQVGEPPARRRAARRPRQHEATLLGEAEWQPPQTQHTPWHARAARRRPPRRTTARRVFIDFVAACVLAVLSVLHGTSTPVRSAARLHILSSPPGARVVYQGEALCPSTPCRIWLPEREAGEVISLHIVRAGCEEFVTTKRIARHPQRLRVQLRCRGERAPAAPR